MKNNKGFSLVELLAVIVILSIILALSTTSVMKIKENQEKKDMVNLINTILTGAKTFATENGNLKIKDANGNDVWPTVGYLESQGKVKYDKSKYDGIDNVKISYEMCEENKLKRNFILTYDGKTFNDLGCVEQVVLSDVDITGDNNIVTLVIGTNNVQSSYGDFAGWNGSGEYYSCKEDFEIINGKKKPKGTAQCKRFKNEDIIKKEN